MYLNINLSQYIINFITQTLHYMLNTGNYVMQRRYLMEYNVGEKVKVH